MKRLLLLLLLILSISYTQAQTSIGAGLTFGTEINGGIGYQLRLLHSFEEPWRAGLDYIRYFDGYDASLSEMVMELNANAHYKFIAKEDRFVYAILGLNYTKSKEVIDAFSYSEIGWNIGTGGQFDIGKQVALGMELKYIIGDAKQLVFSVGGIYKLQ